MSRRLRCLSIKLSSRRTCEATTRLTPVSPAQCFSSGNRRNVLRALVEWQQGRGHSWGGQSTGEGGFKLQGLFEGCLSLPNQKELGEAASRVDFQVIKALCREAGMAPRQGHRVSTWTLAGSKVTVAGCWLPLLLGSRAGGTGGFGLLGSSSRLVLILLLYIFSRISTKVTMMMTTTTMAATMAPEPAEKRERKVGEALIRHL